MNSLGRRSSTMQGSVSSGRSYLSRLLPRPAWLLALTLGLASPASAQAPGTWAPMADLNQPRAEHTATLLASGTVLIAGGRDAADQPLASAEIYDPATGGYTLLASPLPAPVWGHTAIRLNDGTVLIAGGQRGARYRRAAQLFDPATDTFTALGPMSTPRGRHPPRGSARPEEASSCGPGAERARGGAPGPHDDASSGRADPRGGWLECLRRPRFRGNLRPDGWHRQPGGAAQRPSHAGERRALTGWHRARGGRPDDERGPRLGGSLRRRHEHLRVAPRGDGDGPERSSRGAAPPQRQGADFRWDERRAAGGECRGLRPEHGRVPAGGLARHGAAALRRQLLRGAVYRDPPGQRRLRRQRPAACVLGGLLLPHAAE